MLKHILAWWSLGQGLFRVVAAPKKWLFVFPIHLSEGDIELPELREKYLTLAMAKVSTSAYEAYDLGYLRKGHDEITINRSRLLADAKATCIRIGR